MGFVLFSFLKVCKKYGNKSYLLKKNSIIAIDKEKVGRLTRLINNTVDIFKMEI